MTDFQSWLMSITVVAVFGMTVVYKTAVYAIMRGTEKYISPNQARERDQ